MLRHAGDETACGQLRALVSLHRLARVPVATISLIRMAEPSGAESATRPTASAVPDKGERTVIAAHGVQRRVLIVLSAGQILGGVGMGAALSLGSLLVVAVAHEDALAGLAATMTTLGAAAFSVPLARLAGISGRRPALALGTLAAAVGAVGVIAAAAMHSVPLLLVCFGLLGAGSAVNLQTRFAAVDLAADRTRGRDLSLVIWATTVGVVIGPNLAPPGDEIGQAFGMPPLTGAFALTVVCQILAAALYLAVLRPDPLRVANRLAGVGDGDPAHSAAPHTVPEARKSRWAAVTILRHNRGAAGAVIALALSHTTMVAVMAMTPVHLAHAGATVVMIGLTISLHTAGMYGLSPLFGWLSDRMGRGTVIFGGQGLLVASLVTNWFAGDDQTGVIVALILLGLGWSASTIAASALLTESVTVAERTSVQGLSDSLMNLSGAAGGAIAGVVLAWAGYGVLNVMSLALVAAVVVAIIMGRRAAPLK
jgi:MFS family permease